MNPADHDTASAATPMRLLVISYHLAPDGSIGGLRWAGLAKYLARRGWEVHVVSASPQGERRPEPGVHLHFCAPSRTLNDVYNAVARRVRSIGRGTTAADASAGASPWLADPSPRPKRSTRGIGWLRTNLSAVLVFPDYAQGWILPAARLARQLMRQHRFDAVLSSGPPHSAHLAGTLACLRDPGLLWIDMRDPWAALIDKSWAQPIYSSAATRGMVRRLERIAFRRARGVVTNTQEFAEEVRESYPGITVTCVPNGIDPERLPPAPAAKFAGLSIAYAGTLYLGRDLSPVVRAMREFLARRPDARGALRLRVAGSMDAELGARFRNEIAAAGLEDAVEILGRVSGADAMDMINRSHLALVLAQHQPTQIPAKLYECVAMGVRTLVIGETTSAAAREARRVGAIALEESDVDGMCELLESLWADAAPPAAPLETIGYAAISERMDALLRGDRAGSLTPSAGRR